MKIHLGLLGAFVFSAAAQAQSVPVAVTNTAAHPVPTAVVNTPSVIVANGSASPVPVAGQVQVTGSVNVASPVQVSSLPAVNIESPVRVRYQPAGGTPVVDALHVAINFAGSYTGAISSAVPAGKRRIITTITGTYRCDTGHNALLATGANVIAYLPGVLTMNNSLGQDTYAVMVNGTFIMLPGQQATLNITGDGSVCSADIFLSGVEVPDEP